MFNRLSPQICRSALAVAALVALALPAHGEERCSTPDADGTARCEAGLPGKNVQELAVVQEQPQWCWAASISMIFAHHGYRVAQEEIVKDGYGVVTNLPAPSGEAMTHALSRRWIDQDARPFLGMAIASDTLARKFQVSNHKVIAELAAGRPLLLGAVSHAVVLVGLRYERLASGALRITGGTVIDPQPGRGIRPMLRAEMRPTYVAAVQVMAAEQRMAVADAVPAASMLR